MNNRSLAWVGCIALWACSGTKASVVPSGPVGMSTSPASDGIVDDLRAPIVITFPSAIDASSLETATVSLKSLSPPFVPETVIGTLTLAGPNEVRFTPAAPIARKRHRFLLNGLKLTDGTAAPAVDLPFRARLVAEKRSLNYTDGAITSATLVRYTENTERRITFNGAGPNGIFGDADDVVSRWSERTVQPTQVANLFYRGPGVDGVWFNADDQPDLRPTGVGAVLVTLGSDGQPQKDESFQPGPDEKMLTADDVMTARNLYDHSVTREERITSFDAGTDSILGTTDDVPSACTRTVRNTAERFLSDTTASPGTDALCFTSDDIVTYEGSFTYNAAGQRSSSRYTYTYEDDFDPETAEQGGGSDTYAYLPNGDLKEIVSFDAGPDFVPETSDDYVANYTLSSQAGLVEEYFGAGPDRIRNTSDDFLLSKTTFTLEP